MRIVAGKYRGRVLADLNTQATRPTSDRARESVFNILDSRLVKARVSWDCLKVLDAFAGTGALGIEAVSRGVRDVSFMEKDGGALKALKSNLAPLEKDGIPFRIFSDVLNPPKTDVPADLVFMDPPYKKGLVEPAVLTLSEQGWISEKTLCVIETERSEQDFLPAGYVTREERTYGKAKIVFASLADPFFS